MKNFFLQIKRKNQLLLPIVVLIAALFSTISLPAQDKTTGKTLTQKKFQQLMSKRNTVILDVRTPEEYKEGHIPGSLQIDVLKAENFKQSVAGMDKNKKYLIYCHSGKRSASAKFIMKNLGFKKLYDLDGGFSKWTGKKEIK